MYNMSIYQENKPLSLVEQKKLQWAKEREELAKLSVPWGKAHINIEKLNSREKELTKFAKGEISHGKEKCLLNNLPPINRNNKIYETEGETSGYATDSVKEATPEHYQNYTKKSNYEIWTNWNKVSESEASSLRGERPKWRDLKQSSDLQSNSENSAKKMEPPAWLQRGLQNNKEVLVICHSPEQYEEYFERPQSNEETQTYTNFTRTHLRGQNVPLEPTEIAERDIKRQKALELQRAIKQQLEEREIKRRQEREKRIKEEVEEELRISREQEIERQRIENEQRLLEEKKEREQKRSKAMHEAIENAERLAKLEKNKYKHTTRANSEISFVSEQNETNFLETDSTKMKSTTKDNSEYFSNNNEHCEITSTQNFHFQKDSSNVSDNVLNNNYNLVLPNPLDNIQGVQLALLVPAINVTSTLPISLPLCLSNENYAITENRILTPTIYKTKKNIRENSTQTDSSYFSAQENKSGYFKNSDTKYYSLERRATYSIDKKDLKLEERNNSKSEKPKWGVNRPPTRYMKQSEKDPLYQKRKLRQKMREMKLYEEKNNYSESSDDSMSNTSAASTCRKNINRNLWHKNEKMFSQNISVYQTEIVPLEVDEQGRIYVVDGNGYTELHVDKAPVGRKYKERSPDLNTIRLIATKDLWDSERKEKQRLKRLSDSDTATENEGLLEKIKTLRQGLLLRKVDESKIKKIDNDLPLVQRNS